MELDPKEKKEPDKIIRVDGREFRLCKYYDDISEKEILDLPNFDEKPEYTDEGRPFKLAVTYECPYWQSPDPDSPYQGDCGGCILFFREKPDDAIGICMCEELRRQNT